MIIIILDHPKNGPPVNFWTPLKNRKGLGGGALHSSYSPLAWCFTVIGTNGVWAVKDWTRDGLEMDSRLLGVGIWDTCNCHLR